MLTLKYFRSSYLPRLKPWVLPASAVLAIAPLAALFVLSQPWNHNPTLVDVLLLPVALAAVLVISLVWTALLRPLWVVGSALLFMVVLAPLLGLDSRSSGAGTLIHSLIICSFLTMIGTGLLWNRLCRVYYEQVIHGMIDRGTRHGWTTAEILEVRPAGTQTSVLRVDLEDGTQHSGNLWGTGYTPNDVVLINSARQVEERLSAKQQKRLPVSEALRILTK